MLHMHTADTQDKLARSASALLLDNVTVKLNATAISEQSTLSRTVYRTATMVCACAVAVLHIPVTLYRTGLRG
jgi:hypothetical protein